MANLVPFLIPEFLDVNPGADIAAPTEIEADRWATTLNDVIAGLDNIITFFGFTTLVIPQIALVPAGATPAKVLTHLQVIATGRTQIILFQALVMAEARTATRIQRQSIKVQ